MVLSRRRLSPYFLIALLIVLAIVSFRIVQVFLNYLLSALFLAYLSMPAYEWLHAKVKSRALAGLATVGSVAAVIIVPLALLTVELVKELSSIVSKLNAGFLRATFDDYAARLLQFFGVEYETSQAAGDGLLEFIVPSINNFARQTASGLLGALFEGLLGTFILLYVLYYGLVDGRKWLAATSDLLPMAKAHKDRLFEEVGSVIKAVMYGSVLTALMQALLAGFGFYLFGVENVVFWGALTFILALLPIVGPPIIWFPLSVVLLLNGETFNGWGLLLYSAIMVSTLDNFVRPKLIGDRAHVHPAIVLIGVLGGLVVFGFSGFVLGPVILALFVTIADLYRNEFGRPDEVLPGVRVQDG